MAKKIEINENWEPVEVEDLDNLFVVIFKQGSFDQGYVEAFDTDDVLMQSAYDSLAKQYGDCGCDELTKIYLIKIPNTDQTVNMCNTGLFNGNCCDPHVIEATRDLFNRADCEQLSCWEGCGLTEAKKKKNIIPGGYLTITTGDPALNIKHFNKCMGTDGLGDPVDHSHLVVGDTLPNGPVADAGSSNGASDAGSSAGDSGAMGESLNEEKGFAIKRNGQAYSQCFKTKEEAEAKKKELNLADTTIEEVNCLAADFEPVKENLNEAKKENLEEKVRSLIKNYFGEDKSRMSILEYDDGYDGFVEKFDNEEIDFGKFIYNDLSDEDIENGKPVITFLLSGGLNGSGNWEDYLGDISSLFKEFKKELGLHAIVYKIETDILDDVWTAEVLLYIDRDEVKESLNEDLIIIEPFEAKEKIEEIKLQIEEAKDWKVRKNLLTLMNVYLFQTLYESDHKEETDCNIDKEDWEDYSDWAKEQAEELYDEHPELEKEDEEREAKIEASVEDFSSEQAPEDEEKVEESLTESHTSDLYKQWIEDGFVDEEEKQECIHDIKNNTILNDAERTELLKLVNENLTEAHLDYSTQLSKMKQLEAGTRGFNAGSASLEKILYNYDICISHNLPKARKAMEDALRMHGWDQYIKQTKKQVEISDYDHILKPGYVNIAAARTVLAKKDDAQQLIKDYGSNLDDLLIILVIALGMKEAVLAGVIKDHIIKNFTVTLVELKDFLNKYFANPAAISSLNQTIHDCKESLVEDAAYSHKLLSKFELPNQIKLLDQNKVEDFIKQLSPEELFRIGYVTPLYFYSELDDKFDLVKATEMEGYTGLDYRDASVDAADHDERVANAQRQINTYVDGATGHKLNTDGEKFSTSYRATNKLALNPEKSNEYIEYELDAEGKPVVDTNGEKVIKTKIDMNKILFYPRVGSTPVTHYYVDFHNGQGFKPIKREILVDTLYKFIMEIEKANAMGISKTDLMWIQKKGYGNVKKDSEGAIEAFYKDHPEKYAVSIYRKAEELGISAEEYAKEHPFSTRWSMTDFRKKAKSMFDADAATIMAQDASTVSGQELAATRGVNRTVTGFENKPQVRALYSNQVYFLDGKPGKYGNMLKESLTEGCWGMPNTLAEVNKLKDLMMKPIDAYAVGDHVENKNDDLGIGDDELFDRIAKYRKEHGYGTEACNDVRKVIQDFIKDEVLPNWDSYSYSDPEGNHEGETWEPGVKEVFQEIADLDLAELKKQWEAERNKAQEEAPVEVPVEESIDLNEAKRYVKRYYVRPLNIFCGNKEDIIQALIRAGDQNCSVYSLKNLTNHEDVHLLQPSDIIYYWDDHVLYDKNHVQVMDYDLFVKHEEDRKKVGNVDAMTDAAFGDMYDDRATEDDLKDKDVIANYKALNKISR